MKRSFFLLPVLGAAALVTTNALLAQPVTAPQQQPAPSTANAAPTAQVDRGRYLVQLGDCVACHTQKDGARFAGGRPVDTPFGRLLSANLTPDPQTGIGRYNADTFYRALHEGIDHEGRHLYPAFPYNYYTRVTREDSDAMFAYLRTVPPVNHAVDRNQLPFPFNIRALMAVWNAMFLDKGPLPPDPGKPAEWNRGAYLVEGLGHCQACHTPKNALGAARRGEAFRGGAFADWFAPDLTAHQRTGLGGWDDATLREFLRSGANAHGAASGEMGEVVAFSTSQMNDADIAATIAYLRTLAPSPDLKVEAPDAQVMKQGEAIYQDQCASCHRMDGSGVPLLFPPLRGDANLQQSDPSTLVHYVLAGARKVPVDAAPTGLSMPAFGWKLSDQQVAAVLTYARNSWGNSAPAVAGKQVEDLRKKLKLETQPRAQPPVDLAHPGAGTLSTAGTDSRGNGTGDAGKAAPAGDTARPAAGDAPKEQGGGHKAGVPTGGSG